MSMKVSSRNKITFPICYRLSVKFHGVNTETGKVIDLRLLTSSGTLAIIDHNSVRTLTAVCNATSNSCILARISSFNPGRDAVVVGRVLYTDKRFCLFLTLETVVSNCDKKKGR